MQKSNEGLIGFLLDLPIFEAEWVLWLLIILWFVSVAVMIVGITLFLQLATALFRPRKVKYTCQTCGLNRHDPDAVHCKHCGETLKIETEGF